MLNRIRTSFREGLERIRWFSSIFSERVKIEIGLFRLFYASNTMDRKRQELLKAIGQRVIDLRGNADRNIFRDSVVTEALEEIGRIDQQIEELKQKAADLSRISP